MEQDPTNSVASLGNLNLLRRKGGLPTYDLQYHPCQKLGIVHQGSHTSIAPEPKNLGCYLKDGQHTGMCIPNTVANGHHNVACT